MFKLDPKTLRQPNELLQVRRLITNSGQQTFSDIFALPSEALSLLFFLGPGVVHQKKEFDINLFIS